jgi:hypothetical protein
MSSFNLPPGVTMRDVDEHGTHELQRCAMCGWLVLADALDEYGHCRECAGGEARMSEREMATP